MSQQPQQKPRVGDWMATFSGRRFWPYDPRPEDVCIEDIAHHLSLINRFLGATRTAYNVAEHSYWVSYFCDPRDAIEGLFHDGHEAYSGDWISPLKHNELFDPLRLVQAQIQVAICQAFGIRPSEPASVKRADHLLFQLEAKQLMQPERFVRGAARDDLWHTYQPEKLRDTPLANFAIPVWDAPFAEKKFLQRFHELDSQR